MNKSKNPPKLTIDVEYSEWSQPFLDVVYNCGLNIADKDQADILVKAASEISTADLDSGQQIIALEKSDSARIAFRNVLKHPSVIRYVKQGNYKSVDLHNLPTISGRWFTRFLPQEFDFQQPELLITAAEYDKIALGWSFAHYAKLNDIRSIDTQELIDQDADRPIDVFFAGTIKFNDRSGTSPSAFIINKHRENCVNILESIKGYEICVVRGRLLSNNDFNQIICNSKVFVSPWGWGEPCFKDYEAILAGCILIKPRTDFIKTSCHIFENSSCVWTDPDFSNLQNDIISALASFEGSQSKRMADRAALINRIEKLPEIIKDALTL